MYDGTMNESVLSLVTNAGLCYASPAFTYACKLWSKDLELWGGWGRGTGERKIIIFT